MFVNIRDIYSLHIDTYKDTSNEYIVHIGWRLLLWFKYCYSIKSYEVENSILTLNLSLHTI